jgi:hypothetical protein
MFARPRAEAVRAGAVLKLPEAVPVTTMELEMKVKKIICRTSNIWSLTWVF